MIRRGGQRVPGFGVGESIEEKMEEMEKSDPLYDCHHDTYVKLKVFGAIVVASAVTAGIIYIAYRSDLDKKISSVRKELEKDYCPE